MFTIEVAQSLMYELAKIGLRKWLECHSKRPALTVVVTGIVLIALVAAIAFGIHTEL